ncbi:MAG: cupin domain-containing protein, partial [Stellaceae bacterium]
PIEQCERRALVFANPGLGGKPYVTNTIFAAYSLYNPGERAPVHRHTPAASRFALAGNGGFTVVEGEKLQMRRGDLVLTPNGTWHDHGNDGAEPVIWVDVLDVPLVESLNATMFEFDYREADTSSNSGEPVRRAVQAVREREDHSSRLYSAGGLKPLFVTHARGITPHSPMFLYRWEETRRALLGLRDYPGSPYDGIILEYVDPTNGGPVMPTLSFRSQLLRAGGRTLPWRRMASTLYCVLDGAGTTEVEGKRLAWSRNDVFAVPAWQWHHHEAALGEDAFLYSVTDEPALQKLGLYREERRAAA